MTKKQFKKHVKKYYKVLQDSVYWTVMHDGIEHAGYMAFLGLLSFFPFLVLFVALSGVIGQAEISQELVQDIQRFLPENLLTALEPRIQEIISGPPQGLVTVAIIGVLWTASSIVEGTRTILNRAYRVHTPPAYIWRRLLSIVQMLVLTIGLIITMVILIFGPLIWRKVMLVIGSEPDFLAAEWDVIRYTLSSALLFIIVGISYYTLPNIKQRMLNVVPGTLMVMVGWVLAAELFSLYLQRFDQINVVYGSLGGIIATLIFFYIVAVVYIFGAEFNYFLEKAWGTKFEEKEEVPKKAVKKKIM